MRNHALIYHNHSIILYSFEDEEPIIIRKRYSKEVLFKAKSVGQAIDIIRIMETQMELPFWDDP